MTTYFEKQDFEKLEGCDLQIYDSMSRLDSPHSSIFCDSSKVHLFVLCT